MSISPPGFEDASISKREAAKGAKGNSALSENAVSLRCTTTQTMGMEGLIEPLAPVDSGIHIKEESGESSGPPGFAAFKSAVSRRKQLFKDFKDIHVEKRLTRSQTKKARELGSNSQTPISRESVDNLSREGSL